MESIDKVTEPEEILPAPALNEAEDDGVIEAEINDISPDEVDQVSQPDGIKLSASMIPEEENIFKLCNTVMRLFAQLPDQNQLDKERALLHIYDLQRIVLARPVEREIIGTLDAMDKLSKRAKMNKKHPPKTKR